MRAPKSVCQNTAGAFMDNPPEPVGLDGSGGGEIKRRSVVMIDHIGFAVSNYERAKEFYSKALAHSVMC